MDKQVCLVTCGIKGIGLSTAKKFLDNDYYVIVTYKEDEETKKIIADKYPFSIVKCDVSNEKEVKEFINTLDRIDVLVNNAAITNDSHLLDKSYDDFKKVLDTNLIGTFLMSKFVAIKMKEQKTGSIINISSNSGIDDYYPESADYDASKAGVISLTHNLAVELAPYVRVNSIAPGWINTDMNKDLDNSFKSKEENKILLKRFGEVEEVASIIYEVATNNYINNQIIKIDGGYHG